MPSLLVVTADPDLREEVLRLAAAAGVTPDVVADPAVALRTWSVASLVLVGEELVPALARLVPPRRWDVRVLARRTPGEDVFRAALSMGAQGLVQLPTGEQALLGLLAEAGEGPGADGVLLGVVGGSGGSGATTLACALGLVAARQGPACLVDLDPQGAGVGLVLGRDRDDGIHWHDLEATSGRLGRQALRDALPARDGLSVLGWSPAAPRALVPHAVREAVAALTRGHATVVLDLPRWRDPVVDEQLARCARVVVVVQASLPGIAGAARTVAGMGRINDLSLVVRGRGVDASDVARAVGAPVCAVMPDARRLAEDVDLGLGPLRSRRSPLARAAARVLTAAGEAS